MSGLKKRSKSTSKPASLQKAYQHGNVVWRRHVEDPNVIEVLELESGSIFEIDSLAAKFFIELPKHPTAFDCLEKLVQTPTPELIQASRNALKELRASRLVTVK